MKIRRSAVNLILAACAALFMCGCAQRESAGLNPDQPVVITLWHSYNAYAKSVFDQLVTQFNSTRGMELGIVVETYGYGSSSELDDALYNSANRIIGSDPLPDLFTAYPDSACRLDRIVPLAELDGYFNEEEMAVYRKEFLDEGVFEGETSHKMLPIAKSTELLYINQTDWEKFSREAKISDSALTTWEGLAKTAETYYEWSGGKAFLGNNMLNEFAVLTAAQAGAEVYSEDGSGKPVFDYPEEVARKVWDVYYVPHLNGWYKSERYNQDGIKSGRLMAYIGSSAGAGFFPDQVITGRDQGYPIECRIYNYPAFEGGNSYMPQRGANMCMFTSDRLHELAASEFLKWFTQPEQNARFAVSTGYLPVETKALSSVDGLLEHMSGEDNKDAVEKSILCALDGMKNGEFYCKKTFDGSYECNLLFSNSLQNQIESDLRYLNLRTEAGEDREQVISQLTGEQNFKSWYQSLMKEMTGRLNEQEQKK